MRPVRKVLVLVVFGQLGFGGGLAHAGVRECWEWLSGRRSTPFVSRVEKMARRLAQERARNPRFKPEWKPYDRRKTSASDLTSDPGYYWFPNNVYNPLFMQQYPDECHAAARYHELHGLAPTPDLPSASGGAASSYAHSHSDAHRPPTHDFGHHHGGSGANQPDAGPTNVDAGGAAPADGGGPSDAGSSGGSDF